MNDKITTEINGAIHFFTKKFNVSNDGLYRNRRHQNQRSHAANMMVA